ncbi:MAG: hypothetical protein GF370_01005 [Candidatus Nealsonbacteria bacterium]|nr:hypothetical protein [Candidatus Nealsonbacteria bacterium]
MEKIKLMIVAVVVILIQWSVFWALCLLAIVPAINSLMKIKEGYKKEAAFWAILIPFIVFFATASIL